MSLNSVEETPGLLTSVLPTTGVLSLTQRRARDEV